MSDNGKQYDQDDNFEQRLYQTLALIERAGDQQRSAAATVERLDGLEQRINQVIQTAATEASARIASEARSALDARSPNRPRLSARPRAAQWRPPRVCGGRGGSTYSLSWPPVS
jgi:hypothetical protein